MDTNDIEISEYRKQFLDELRFDAEHEGTDVGTKFIEKVLDELEDIGELSAPCPLQVEIKGYRQRLMSFDAYAYDEADSALILIASEFVNERESVETLTNSRIDELVTRMENFIGEVVNGDISKYCDESDDILPLAKEFRKKIGKSLETTEIMRFKFVIISNLTLSRQVKNLTKENFLERPVELNVWTLERLYQTFTSNTSEIIEFDTMDFGCEGIQYLKANIGCINEYDAYLGIVPGKFLADLYLKYGSKLLQGNVRAFLSVRGAVNKGIRNTIINHPQNFFTYNNGIAIVARSVRFSEDGKNIVHFKDFQIINGGQTTASLANALIKKEIKHNMETLFVPMKLTVLNVEDDMSEEQIEQYNNITKTISECANSQNAVSKADFFSNHPFHIKMEELSRKVMAPAVEGSPYQTIWFYERSRGKWEQEQMKLTQAQRKRFCEGSPKKQVIKKEKLAKCFNSILMKPYQVCQSAAINFSRFAPYVEDLYGNHRDSINEHFFRKSVCSVIIFDTLDDIVNRSEWYPKGGNKAQIVPYSISKLMSLLPKDYDIDWQYIWQKQKLYPELANELSKISYCAHRFLMEKAKGGLVRTISRLESTWNDFKNYDFHLSEKFVAALRPVAETKHEERAAKRTQRFNSKVDLSVQIFKLGFNYWMEVYNALSKARMLSYGETSFIKGIADFINKGKLPSSAQCNRLMKIIDKAEGSGYILPE